MNGYGEIVHVESGYFWSSLTIFYFATNYKKKMTSVVCCNLLCVGDGANTQFVSDWQGAYCGGCRRDLIMDECVMCMINFLHTEDHVFFYDEACGDVICESCNNIRESEPQAEPDDSDLDEADYMCDRCGNGDKLLGRDICGECYEDDLEAQDQIIYYDTPYGRPARSPSPEVYVPRKCSRSSSASRNSGSKFEPIDLTKTDEEFAATCLCGSDCQVMEQCSGCGNFECERTVMHTSRCSFCRVSRLD
jgi:hypothetical protein